MSKPKILIVDDEKQIRKILQISLSANNYQVIEAENGQQGLNQAVAENPDCIVLDLGLPDIDGINVLSKLREWYASPIIILSVRRSEKDIIKALDNGANDYVTKPFSTGEILARIRVALRNNHSSTKAVYTNNNLTVDLSARTVKKADENIKLTSTEYSILWLFIQNENKVITHKYILERIWGNEHADQTQYLRVYIGQLRKKIEDDYSDPQYIITESGIGYRFVNNNEN
ncbi:response regulator transcription factor [bacterium]|nr:MAG: response regulator transcription factor [bacterium]